MSSDASGSSYYADGTRLEAKNELAASTDVDFPTWALGKLDLTGAKQVLDAGFGWGRFALPLAERSHAALTCLDV